MTPPHHPRSRRNPSTPRRSPLVAGVCRVTTSRSTPEGGAAARGLRVRRARLLGMTSVHRVLPPEPVADLAEHLRRRGGEGLEAARALAPDVLIAEVLASGLRGRGGAGFPTGVKWRAGRDNRSAGSARRG